MGNLRFKKCSPTFYCLNASFLPSFSSAEHRRKKLLRAAQKSIMLWEPGGAARKPPRESVDLILSVEAMFGLSEIFQQSIRPDFVLMSIGDTTRQSVERAYDWLIPVTSSLPEIINRLPASASCFLLLRAYGAEGDESNQLRELSAPLLVHVSESLTGKFGQDDAIRATDLLLADVTDRNPDRRRCARRVLQEALTGLNRNVEDSTLAFADCTWLFSILQVHHAPALIADCIRYIVSSALFAYIFKWYKRFAHLHGRCGTTAVVS